MPDPITNIERHHIHVDGVVQGVGFRPFIYGLATHAGLKGWVLNHSSGVDIEVQGSPEALIAFEYAITKEAPPLARIDCVVSETVPLEPEEDAFTIRQSKAGAGSSLVSPDVRTCDDCLNELFDPTNRRYRYPFTNCTNCGPRYTIIQGLPYDRPMTTMRGFPLCADCKAEYFDPLDRRFHAQPNACPVCGPCVELVSSLDNNSSLLHGEDDIARAAALLRDGRIVAIKGLGGFHLACDATNTDAVARLRAGKHRPDKPFAVMMASLDMAREYCHVSDHEAALLTSPGAPIVLLYRRSNTNIVPRVAPSNPRLGVMLPYTPLHHILLRDVEHPIVMTSGNLSDMPLITENDEALEVLLGIADYFLLHDRPIHIRCDDAVWWVDESAATQWLAQQPLRRSRGDAPYPIRLPWRSKQHILATGGEMKNTLCLLRGGEAFLSQHIGEITSPQALISFRETFDHMSDLFHVSPEIIVHDLHPSYVTTRIAKEIAAERGIETIPVQHHHAHIAACLGEHGNEGPVIGLALDGTGYGLDGAIWGGEVLIADVRKFERVAHLEYLPMPGGEAAIRQPYRLAWGYLLKTLGEIPQLPHLSEFSREERRVVEQQIARQINTPLTSSCGRLFDAVSALIGICTVATFEAQAAIALELAAREADIKQILAYPFLIEDDGVLRITPLLRAIAEDVIEGRRVAEIAAAFHLTVAEIFHQTTLSIRTDTGLNSVALSGGVFQNRLFLHLLRDKLITSGFEILAHEQVPTNDGGLSLGQAVVALHHTQAVS